MAEQTFKDLLDAYTVIIFRAGRDGIVNTPAPVDEKQALLDYVARLEANQITPEMIQAAQWYQASHDPIERELYIHLIMSNLAKMGEGE